MTPEQPDNRESLAASVRRHDRDRYRIAAFVPDDRRAHVLALLAFNIEIAGIAEKVSEPLVGEMRLQWWRDAIDAMYAGGNAPKTPVAVSLGEAIRRHGLRRGDFDHLLEARSRDLDAAAFATLDDLLGYAEGTAAPLNRLILDVLRPDPAPSDDGDRALNAAATAAGVAWSLTGLVRAVPFHGGQGRCYVPEDVLASIGHDRDSILRRRAAASLADAVRPLADEARRRIAEARAYRRRVPRWAVPALLPCVTASHYLKALRKAGHDPTHPNVQRQAGSAMLRLLWHAARGRY